MTTSPVTPLPWRLPIARLDDDGEPVVSHRSGRRSQQRLPARSPHTLLALFLALCSIACPPLGSLTWWYASTELARIAAGELWPHNVRALIIAKGCGVAATTACATFLFCAALARFS